MEQTIQELSEIVNEFINKFSAIPEEEFSAKPLPHKWSKKEVLGHLIDSAQNNLRRFIVGQYENDPPKIIYDQDFWVASNGYQNMAQNDVINYWHLINESLANTLANMPASNYAKECNTGKDNVQLHSLEWLAHDYVKHMKHHINQIIANSFDVVYVSK